MKTLITKTLLMLTFKLEQDGKQIHAFCPELKGCHSFGNTPQEALKNLKEAMSLYLDDELESQTVDELIDDGNVKI
jgi:predicted RNase H-like HicB family nuclease